MMAAFARAWQKPRGFLLDVGPALLYLAVLFWFGLTPLKSLPGPQFALQDKAWHLVAFGGAAALLARSLGHWGRKALPAARDAAAAAISLGGLLELLQSLTAYRSADWADFVADSLGAGLAYVTLRKLHAAATSAPA